MKYIHHSILNREEISFAINAMSGNNGILSKLYSDYANIAKTWLFLRPNTAGVNPSCTHFVNTKHLSSYDGVTPQNKPSFGEYVGRFLYRPRVNPITLFGRFSQTQNYTGAFAMNAIITPFKSFHLSAAHSFLIGCLLGLPIACLVFGILAVMGV